MSGKSQKPIENIELDPACHVLKFLSTISYNTESILYTINLLPDTNVIYACKKIFLDRIPENQRNRIIDLESNLRSVRRLIHPHIIKCYRVFSINNSVYFVMEYCPLGSMYDLLNKIDTPFLIKSTRLWFGQILGAVNYIHSRGLAHRNITLTSILQISSERMILSGFTHCCLAYKRDIDIMRTTVFRENLQYQAPEMHPLCSQIWPYDAKSTDMYSMGVVLFQMVNRDPPFDVSVYNTNPVTYINNQRNREYTYKSAFSAFINSKFKHLIWLLLEPKPGVRITSSTALVHEALLPED
ncbi:hypothetical protein RDWZM_005316 [Blomia tropicalis]|uniref:Protein kinase domain-containing protein n=1 Tax=Blomia tropicalis TaxID=40697 RepID=A0A9Q0RM81_BLOTA|nr:protein serine threonine kinase [Blomia tropicalis]KAJ6219504.1 hypothetical protein RDWZM_005316 [Blomia tropicalis]